MNYTYIESSLYNRQVSFSISCMFVCLIISRALVEDKQKNTYSIIVVSIVHVLAFFFFLARIHEGKKKGM